RQQPPIKEWNLVLKAVPGYYDRRAEPPASPSARTTTQPPARTRWPPTSLQNLRTPHAHRRNNPPTGAAAGTICGEPSAPLRRCQQPLLFPKNPEPELTTIHNSGAALVWNQRREVVNGQQPANDECPDNAEVEQEEPEQHKETTEPAAPSGGANAAAGGRRNPPGGKSSLILG
uniref:Jupiter microtubule associated homolog 1b n=1 Tax=Sander lucioperca TaxID=283035 RepID=A0A8D0A358_SANLU